MNNNKKKILYVVNVDWFFLSHRLPLAKEALKRGFEVAVATTDTGKRREIEKEGLIFYDLKIVRNKKSITEAFKTIYDLIKIFKFFKPDLVHFVTVKPILYGNIARLFVKKFVVVNAISGMGSLFSDENRDSFLSKIVLFFYSFVLSQKQSATIFQNTHDLKYFVNRKLIPQSQAWLIRGSGVNHDKFSYIPEYNQKPIVMFASRLLWDKGIKEFVDAASIVKKSSKEVRFVIIGEIDKENPTAIDKVTLNKWCSKGIIEYWGYKKDMDATLRLANIVVLPSYHEGLPKILIEACSSGRAVIASNIPGCAEIINHDLNGFLVEPKNSHQLAKSILTLVNNPEKRRQMGLAGREKVIDEFSLEIVINKTFDLYSKLLAK